MAQKNKQTRSNRWIRFAVSADTHYRLKAAALAAGTTLQDLVVGMITNQLPRAERDAERRRESLQQSA